MFWSILSCTFISEPESSSDSIELDVVLVLDNSASMSQEAGAFATAIPELKERLRDLPRSEITFAVTTTTVDYTSAGNDDGLEPGEAGLLTGDPLTIELTDPEFNTKAQHNILCEATYWDTAELLAPENQDPDYDCDSSETPESISVQYLDCLCGVNEWQNPSGSGQEEPLEAALMTICRSEEDPPDVCYEYAEGIPSIFGSNDQMTNPEFNNENTPILFIIMGDEGDASRRIPNGSEDIEPYLEAFDQFDRDVYFISFGPNLVADEDGLGYSLPCNNGGATDWASIRLLNISEDFGGFYRSLETEINGECSLADFTQLIIEVADWMIDL